MNSDPIITESLSVLKRFNPKSVFLYGSRGRDDFKPDSDYEIGVIFDDEKYVSRSAIHAVITNPLVKVYPFKWSELSLGTFSHVFQKSLYLREIILGGCTIDGERLIEGLPLPDITTLDLIQRVRFDIGMALAALLSFRANDMPTSMEEFSKSCFFGLRSLEILEFKKFPVGYDEIFDVSASFDLEPKYQGVIEAARAVRTNGQAPTPDMIFNNISLLDSYIEPKVLNFYKSNGDIRII